MEGVESAMGPIPDVGQHTEAILEELGVGPQIIAAFATKSHDPEGNMR